MEIHDILMAQEAHIGGSSRSRSSNNGKEGGVGSMLTSVSNISSMSSRSSAAAAVRSSVAMEQMQYLEWLDRQDEDLLRGHAAAEAEVNEEPEAEAVPVSGSQTDMVRPPQSIAAIRNTPDMQRPNAGGA